MDHPLTENENMNRTHTQPQKHQNQPLCNLWRNIRSPFTIPASCHTCRDEHWEQFDADKAGCLKCGKLHLCTEGRCHTVLTESHFACTLTGFITKNQNFQQQYVENGPTTMTVEKQKKRWITHDQIEYWFERVTQSDKWKACMEKEMNRIFDKMNNMFFKVAKQWKIMNRHPNVIDIFTEVRVKMGYIRIPLINIDRELYDRVTQLSILHIMQFTTTFRTQLMKVIPVAKTNSLIIGLIYMLRHGLIVLDSLTILPCFSLLKRLLPMETCLKSHFHVQCKIITETENIIKSMLKSINEHKLRSIIEKNYNKQLPMII